MLKGFSESDDGVESKRSFPATFVCPIITKLWRNNVGLCEVQSSELS